MKSSCLIVLSLAAAAASAQQQQYLPWEQQTDVGSIPAWYAPKASGFASPAGAPINLAASSTGGFPSSPYAARPSYPPNFPGYPTFGTVQPVGPHAPPKSPTGGRSNLDKYLPLMKKKKASSTTTTTTSTTTLPSTTRRRKLPTKKNTTVTSRKPTTTVTTTVRPTTVRPVRTTTVPESGEWESVEIVEATTAKATVQTTSTSRPTTTSEKKKVEWKKVEVEKKKVDEKKEEVEKFEKFEKKEVEEAVEKLIKGPIVPRGKPERPAFLSTTVPPRTTVKTVETSSEVEEKEAEFNLLGFLWDKSELLASIKNMIKQLKSSIDEAGLEEDVKQVSDHFKNTIKTFASASPVNEQLGRLFERAQNSDVKLD